MRLAKHNVELLLKVLEALGTGAAIGVIAFTFLKAVPIYLKNYEFEKAVRREARLVVTDPKPAPTIQGDVYRKAQELGVPVQIDQIRVDSGELAVPQTGILDTVMAPQSTSPMVPLGTVEIEIYYAVPIRFPGYTLELRFHVHADDHSA